jgi:hypothetical protein
MMGPGKNDGPGKQKNNEKNLKFEVQESVHLDSFVQARQR